MIDTSGGKGRGDCPLNSPTTLAISSTRSPWNWIPSLYFAQGIPYVIVMTLSVVMYKRLGVSNTDIALYTSLLYLPWVIKPLWSPAVDLFKTKRYWIIGMQLAISLALALAAFSLHTKSFFFLSLAVFWIMAFCSATHDIAADGFYMLALPQHDQAWWVGIRSTFYRLAMIAGSGLLVMLAGLLEHQVSPETTTNEPLVWSITLGVAAILFSSFCLWHWLMLPRPMQDGPVKSGPTTT